MGPTAHRLPLVSIIVPVYGVEKYLRDCIESLRRQSYRNIEVILVDDGSPDNCGTICDRFASQDPRIRVLHKSNGGLSSARNAGLDIAGGDYIGFVDSDDIASPQMYERLVEAQHSTRADLVRCGFIRFPDGTAPPLTNPKATAAEVFRGSLACLEAFIDMQINPAVWNKLYSRRSLSDLRFPVGRTHEDEFFTPSVCLRSAIAATIPDQLYFYRQRAVSITSRKYSVERLDAVAAYRRQLRLFQAQGVSSNKLRQFSNRMQSEVEFHFRMLESMDHLDPDRRRRRRLQQDYRSIAEFPIRKPRKLLADLVGFVSLRLLLELRRINSSHIKD